MVLATPTATTVMARRNGNRSTAMPLRPVVNLAHRSDTFVTQLQARQRVAPYRKGKFTS